MIKETKTEMPNIFNKHYKKYDAWYDNHQAAFLSEIAAIKKLLPATGQGLEIGVGTGRFAKALNISHGIDPAEKMVVLASKRGIDVCVGKGELLPYENESFDYVLIMIALCFVRDPVEVLKQANRVLKKNGKIIIGIVDRESFLGKFYQKKESVFYKEARFFSVPELRELLKTAGFDNPHYFQTIFRLLEDITVEEEPQEGFGKGGFVVVGADKPF